MRINSIISCFVVIVLLSLSVISNAQTRRRFYNPLDLQIDDLPESLDTVAKWINPYLGKQFIKSINGSNYNFKLALRHLDTLDFMGSSIKLLPKTYENDSTEEPFTSIILVKLRKSLKPLSTFDQSPRSYIELVKEQYQWRSGTALYRTSWYLVNEGKAFKEYNSIRYYSVPREYTVLPDYSEEDEDKPHFDVLIDTINHLLSTNYAYGLKPADLNDQMIRDSHNVLEVIDQLYFKNSNSHKKDSLLNLFFEDEGGMKTIKSHLTHFLDISGFPFDIALPLSAIRDKYKQTVSSIDSLVKYDVYSFEVEVRPSLSSYTLIISMVGRFNSEDGMDKDLTRLYIVLKENKGALKRYNSQTKKLESLIYW